MKKLWKFLVKKYDKLGRKLQDSKFVVSDNYHDAKKKSKLKGFIKVRKVKRHYEDD
jgi:hypothetical protein